MADAAIFKFIDQLYYLNEEYECFALIDERIWRKTE